VDNEHERPHMVVLYALAKSGLYTILVWALLIIHDGQSRTLGRNPREPQQDSKPKVPTPFLYVAS